MSVIVLVVRYGYDRGNKAAVAVLGQQDVYLLVGTVVLVNDRAVIHLYVPLFQKSVQIRGG